MFEELGAVVHLLASRGVPHALVGAAAMAGLGVVRASDDLDLLVVETAVLEEGFWRTLSDRGTTVDLRRGDDQDPLAGVVRLSRPGEAPIDVVVGRRAWQREAIARARPIRIGGVDVPLVGAADLVLLKLYAGGPQDAADVRLILGSPEGESVRSEVEERLPALPRESHELWRTIVEER